MLFHQWQSTFYLCSLSLYIKISFKYQSLTYCTDLGFAYCSLMCTCTKTFSVFVVPYIYNSTLRFFSELPKMFNISYRFFLLFLATSNLYCFTVDIYNHIIQSFLKTLTCIQNGHRLSRLSVHYSFKFSDLSQEPEVNQNGPPTT